MDPKDIKEICDKLELRAKEIEKKLDSYSTPEMDKLCCARSAGIRDGIHAIRLHFGLEPNRK